MNRIWLLASWGLVVTAAAQNIEQRPNVILLVADDLGYADISCYGAKGVETPCIDSIARGGIRFVDAHACASTSTPSRYSLLTGEYPFRKAGTGIAKGDESMIIAPEQYTVADVFHEAGYVTGAVGKWHLGLGSMAGKQDWNGLLDQHLGDLGFDYHYIMAATADRVPCAFIENGRIANYDASAPIYVSYQKNFPGEPTGKDHPELLTKLKSSHGHNQAIVNGIGRIGFMKGGGKALWKDENIADSITAHAIRFMEENTDHPFFLYLATNDVHVPRFPHERFRGKSPMGLRGEAILQFDWTIRQVVESLHRLGIADNTLLIITSDNGPVLDDGYQDQAVQLVGNHLPSGPFRGGKYSVYEGGTVVPFIVNWPGVVPAGRESTAMVSQIDNLASLAQLVGVDVPQGAACDSRPQLETWLGKSDASCPFAMAIGGGKTIDVRQGKWKYIEPKTGKAYASGPNANNNHIASQLYDLSASVKENENLAVNQRDKVIYFENLIDSVLMVDYPISFDKTQVVQHPNRVLKSLILRTASDGEQELSLSNYNKIYVDMVSSTFRARPGDVISPQFSYTGKQMNGYVYVDYDNDGQFNTQLRENLTPDVASELVSYSYYGKNNADRGQNSLGETLSGIGRYVLDPPSFTLPKDLSEGYYRMRFKIDYNDINPNGSSSIVEEDGRIVDVRLEVHGDWTSLRAYANHGQVKLSEESKDSVRQVPYGQSVTVSLIPDKGYEICGLRVRQGYHMDAAQFAHHNMQWENIYFERELMEEGIFEIPGRFICGAVEIEGVFVEEGTYVKPEKKMRYETTTLTQGAFSAATPWYSLQISTVENVLSDNGGRSFIQLGTEVVEEDNPAHLWCFIGNEEDGYRIYNMQAGPTKVLAAPVLMKGRNGGESYPILVESDQIPDGYVDIWRFEDSYDLGGKGKEYAYLYEDGFVNHAVNKRNDRLAFWSAGKDAGSTLIVRFVRYGDTVSGIMQHVQTESGADDTYDLGGRRVKTKDRGIYLRHGRKVYVH